MTRNLLTISGDNQQRAQIGVVVTHLIDLVRANTWLRGTNLDISAIEPGATL
jgi:hypothetical protein